MAQQLEVRTGVRIDPRSHRMERVVSLRMTEEEYQVLAQQAAAEDRTLANMLRRLLRTSLTK